MNTTLYRTPLAWTFTLLLVVLFFLYRDGMSLPLVALGALGGFAVLGVPGVVVGPLAVSLTLTLLDILRDRRETNPDQHLRVAPCRRGPQVRGGIDPRARPRPGPRRAVASGAQPLTREEAHDCLNEIFDEQEIAEGGAEGAPDLTGPIIIDHWLVNLSREKSLLETSETVEAPPEK